MNTEEAIINRIKKEIKISIKKLEKLRMNASLAGLYGRKISTEILITKTFPECKELINKIDLNILNRLAQGTQLQINQKECYIVSPGLFTAVEVKKSVGQAIDFKSIVEFLTQDHEIASYETLRLETVIITIKHGHFHLSGINVLIVEDPVEHTNRIINKYSVAIEKLEKAKEVLNG